MSWQLDVTVDFTCHIRLIACCTSVLSRNLDHYNGNETPINLICLPLSQLWAYSGILPRIKIIDVNVLSRHRTINFRYFSHISFPFKIKILSVILLAFLVSKKSLPLWVKFSFQIAWYNSKFSFFELKFSDLRVKIHRRLEELSVWVLSAFRDNICSCMRVKAKTCRFSSQVRRTVSLSF